MSRIPEFKFYEVNLDPNVLTHFTNEDSLWFETAEEIELGVQKGQRKLKQVAEVKRVMKRVLTQRQQQCVELYYLDAKSLREVAAILGLDFTTVHQHVTAGVRKLRKALTGINQSAT